MKDNISWLRSEKTTVMTKQFENALIIFIKNPEEGKVKTRLAKTIGSSGALNIYKKLLNLTLQSALEIPVSRQLWYSSYIDYEDEWGQAHFGKFLQEGDDLGVRMKKAFAQAFDEGFEKVVIIGSDCPDVTPEILQQAFSQLDEKPVVIGPARDGGYYLLGMRYFIPSLFLDKNWSTKRVYSQTTETLNQLNVEFEVLPELNDIDTEEDLKKSTVLNDKLTN